MDKANFLQLHVNGKDCRVNVAAIAAYSVNRSHLFTDEEKTVIYLVGGQTFAVSESVDEIDQAISGFAFTWNVR